MTVASLPLVNAIFNGLSTVLLLTGYVLIRQRRMRAHGMVMLGALVSSTLFLAGYLVHKWYYPDVRVATRFPHLPDAWRYFYWFVVLIPHLILAVVMLPFIAAGLWHAYRRQFQKHRRVNRITIWMWLYVSITGVLIYVLLYHLFPAIEAARASAAA